MWQLPDGTNVPVGIPNNPNTAAVGDGLIITGVFGVAVALHRGPTHFSPDGEHCCVRIAAGDPERRCVTFSECWLYCLCPILTPTPTAPCPTLRRLSNGNILYDADTNIATYICNTGYFISGTTDRITTAITCMQSDGTTTPGTWSLPPSTCSSKTFILN